jgi:hypothetical protein
MLSCGPAGMTLLPSSDRTITLGHRVLPWAVGAAVLILRGRSLELVPPSPCPGVLELVSIAAVTTWPDLTTGALFGTLHAVTLVIGVAAFVALAARATSNICVAAATGLAVGLGPFFPATLAPPWEAAAFAVCAAGGLVMTRRPDRPARQSCSFALRVSGLALLAALIVPPWTALAAMVAGVILAPALPWSGRAGRGLAAFLWAAGIALLVLAVLNWVRPDALSGSLAWRSPEACVVPWPTAPPVSRGADIVRVFGWIVGPLALALAVLGAAAQVRPAGRRRAVTIAVIGLACLALTATGATDPRITLAPWVVGLWWFVAAGLRKTLDVAGRGTAARVVGVFLLLLLPTLEGVRRAADDRDNEVRPHGHENATLRQVDAMLDIVPAGAAFAEEDASLDVLLRGSALTGRYASKGIKVVPLRFETIGFARRTGPVYAFPRGRKDLEDRGFITEPVPVRRRRGNDVRERIDGLSIIVGTRRCRMAQNGWVDVGDALVNGRITLVAGSEAARGPVVLYLGGSTAAVPPSPDGWPTMAAPGFVIATFDQRTSSGTSALAADARSFGLPLEHPVLAAPFVVRMELGRTPRAPFALPVLLGASYQVGVTKLERDGMRTGDIMVCDAPPIGIASFGVHRE